ncbi:sigma-70 family RNA polymerase sigma factor [Paenibacillus macerans]|uniref:Sigma-70 family RNA polymerase sigma factor n=1 Tax=Paenibacillus macerans TaxID=44252 RepID=A0A6N8ESR2_PAEMA|nr:sigma-70 family RNA polymerase sigma factor [Paenibacillus macerans]
MEVSKTLQEPKPPESLRDPGQIEDIVQRIQQGEREEFALIVQAFQQPIFRYCCRLLGNRQDAEDAVQDVLFKAYKSIGRYKPAASFSSWLYRIACNHCLNLLRRRRLQSRIMRIFKPETAAGSPEQKMEESLYSETLQAALMKLSLEERNMLVLRVFEQLSYQEMSEILQVSPNALNKRMKKTMNKMKACIEHKEEMECNTESVMSTKI